MNNASIPLTRCRLPIFSGYYRAIPNPSKSTSWAMLGGCLLLFTGCWLTPFGLAGATQKHATDPFHAPTLGDNSSSPEGGLQFSTQASADPLQLSAIPLHNAEAKAVAELLKTSGALSPTGSVSTDQRTNTLVLRDLPVNIQTAHELIAQLDKPSQQIMVEARIVLASGDYTLDLGNRLGLERRSSSRHLIASTNSLLSGSRENHLDDLLIDLPPIESGGQFGFSVGKIGSSLLQFELSAMEAEGHGEVISSPRVLTTERRQARIEQGVQIPYQQSADAGATSVAFRDASLSLTVTPTISHDGSVSLELEVTKDAVGQVFAGVPSIDTQAVTTHMRVNDGETVILGGVREQEQHEEQRWVPWLANLPLLGRLFRHSRERSRYQELLIFVTPKVINSTAELQTEAAQSG